MTGTDDNALRWDGDDDATLNAGTDADTGRVEPESEAEAETEPDDLAGGEAPSGDASDGGESDQSALGFSNAALIGIGVFAGVYALFTAGWVLAALRLYPLLALFTPVQTNAMFWLSIGLSIVGPLAWFAATWLLTQKSATWVRMLALLIGAIVLIPWPVLSLGALA